jgi:O-antigen ligase
MLLAPFLDMTLPLTVFYWTSLSRGTRRLGLLAIALNIGLYIAMGVNQGVILPIVMIPFFVLAAAFARRIRVSPGRILTGATLCVLALVGGFSYFAATAMTREGSGAVSGTFAQINATADRDNFMVRGLSDEATIGMFGLTGYVGQGYYGLSLALEKPFKPMYGVGHSMFLYRQAARLTGDRSLEQRSYPDRLDLEEGWTVVRFFQTIYPWFASDVGFLGTLVVVALIGAIVAASWRDTLRGDNPFAVAFLGQLVFMLLFFPALNALLQDGEGIASFWVLLIAWLTTQRRTVLWRHSSR